VERGDGDVFAIDAVGDDGMGLHTGRELAARLDGGLAAARAACLRPTVP
jgi:hypothetical protein